MADVEVSVGLNIDEVDKQADELRKEVNKALGSVDGKKVDEAMAKTVVSMEKAVNASEKLGKKLQDLNSQKAEISNIFKSEDFAKFTEASEKVKATQDALNKAEAASRNFKDTTLQDARAQADNAKAKLDNAKATKQAADETLNLAKANKAAALQAKEDAKRYVEYAKAKGTSPDDKQFALENYEMAKQTWKAAVSSTEISEGQQKVEEANKLLGEAEKQFNIANKALKDANAKQAELVSQEAKARTAAQDATKEKADVSETTGISDESLEKANKQAEILDDKIKDVALDIKGSNVNMQVLVNKFKEAGSGAADMEKNVKALSQGLALARVTAHSIGNVMKSILQMMRNIATGVMKVISSFTAMHKSVKSTNKELNRTSITMKSLIGLVAKYVLGFRSLFFLIRRIRSFIISGFTNILSFMDEFGTSKVQKEFKDFYDSIQKVKVAIETLRYSFVAAFTPLVTVVAPYIAQAINWLSKLIGYVGQLIAYLTGSSTYLTANANAMKKLTDETKKNNKTNNKQLSNLDKLNNMTTKKDSKDPSAFDPSKLFTRKPIEGWIKDLGDKLKELFAKLKEFFVRLWGPIKKAWDRVKDYIIAGFKHIWDAWSKFIGLMAEAFLQAWESGLGESIFYHLFHIFGDILEFIALTGDKLYEAFSVNDNALRFWTALLQIIDAIIGGIDAIADSTIKWYAEQVSFIPLVDSLVNYLESLVPVVQLIMKLLLDLWEHIVEPFAEYIIEEFLPKLFDRFAKFNNVIADNAEKIENAILPIFDSIEKGLEGVGDWILDVVDKFLLLIETFIQTGSTGVPFFDAIIEAIGTIIEGVLVMKDRIQEWITSFLETGRTGNMFIDLILTAIQGIAEAINLIGPEGVANLIELFAMFKVVGPVLSAVVSGLVAIAGAIGSIIGSKGLELLVELLTGSDITATLSTIVSNISAVIGVTIKLLGGIAMVVGGAILAIVNFLDMLKNGFDYVKEAFMLLGTVIAGVGLVILGVPGLIAAAIAAVGAAIMTLIVNWQDIVDMFKELGIVIYDIIYNDFMTITTVVFAIFDNIVNYVKDWFSALGNIVSTELQTLWTLITEIWQSIYNTISDILDSFKLLVMAVVEFITTGSTEGFTELGKAWINIFLTIKENVITIVTSMWTGLKNVLNAIISGVEKMANSVVGGISHILSSLNSIDFKLPDWVGGGDFKLNLPSNIKPIKLPRLAEGTVVPPSASEFAAILGDNNRETEVVSPLSTMTQAFKDALAETNFGGGASSLTATATISGHDLLQIIVEENNKFKMRHGYDAV